MKCPICNQEELVAQSLEDCFGSAPDIFCPRTIKIPNGRLLNHYREIHDKQGNIIMTRIIVLPYRIVIKDKDSQVSVLSRRRGGDAFFKTILKVPAIHPDLEDKLKSRIKLLTLFS